MNKPIELREADFKKAVFEHKYPKLMLEEFFDYWSERSTRGVKMRFEMEKTWSLSRRLGRWANNGFNKDFKKEPQKKMHKEHVEPKTDFERLDAFIARYRANINSVPFDAFAEWYDLMKANRLLKQFTKVEIEEIKLSYGDDKMKCRSACVQRTVDGYVNNSLTVKDILELRERLNGSATRI